MDVTVGDKTYKVEEGLLYIKTHQWARIEGNMVTMGITDYAQQQLGELQLVDLADAVGAEVSQVQMDGDEPSSDPLDIVSIESSKAVGDVYSPVSGTVKEANEALEDEPETVNSDPYGAGWLLKIEASNLDAEKGNLLDAKAYAEFIKSL
ncbi:MAG: glycine cleavage system protein GcvH [Promethearchaeota archaeon]